MYILLKFERKSVIMTLKPNLLSTKQHALICIILCLLKNQHFINFFKCCKVRHELFTYKPTDFI